jgi:glycine/D-amino acid oxidase-like deaminating enzyme
MWDALIIGGGFYGTSIATYLSTRRNLKRVVLVEREADLLQRASINNQARVHNGYHYPRSFTTAFRSRVNLPRFMKDYPEAVHRDFTKLYAIASRNSHVTCRHFKVLCREIGASLRPAPPALSGLFEPRLIEGVFLVEEWAFDALKLRARAHAELAAAGVDVRLKTRVTSLHAASGTMLARVRTDEGVEQDIEARYVFNCTYSGLNQLSGDFPGSTAKLKHELTEMALVQVPPELSSLGITLMDGAFFSLMPFPSRGLHTLSHVRYTPHYRWSDQAGVDPYAHLASYEGTTRVERMIRDASRYVPAIRKVQYVESMFEIKTVLGRNEADDGRPILFERHQSLPQCYSILGGKIDNIYDVLQKLDAESLS